MFKILEETEESYRNYQNELAEFRKKNFDLLSEIDREYVNAKNELEKQHDKKHEEQEKFFEEGLYVLEEKYSDVIDVRNAFLKRLPKRSIFDLKVIGSSLAKIVSYYEDGNYVFEEKSATIKMIRYPDLYNNLKYNFEKNIVCGYISKNGDFPEQDQPLDADYSISDLFTDNGFPLYCCDAKYVKNTHMYQFYTDEYKFLNAPKYLKDFIDELISYRIENRKDLSAEECNEIADNYISKLKGKQKKLGVR